MLDALDLGINQVTISKTHITVLWLQLHWVWWLRVDRPLEVCVGGSGQGSLLKLIGTGTRGSNDKKSS